MKPAARAPTRSSAGNSGRRGPGLSTEPTDGNEPSRRGEPYGDDPQAASLEADTGAAGENPCVGQQAPAPNLEQLDLSNAHILQVGWGEVRLETSE